MNAGIMLIRWDAGEMRKQKRGAVSAKTLGWLVWSSILYGALRFDRG